MQNFLNVLIIMRILRDGKRVLYMHPKITSVDIL